MAELVPAMSQLVGVICGGALIAFLMLTFAFKLDRIWSMVQTAVETFEL